MPGALGDVGRSAMGWAITGAQTAAGIVAVAALALFAGQSHLIYQPSMPPGSRVEVPTPPEFGMQDWEEISLASEDNTQIKAFVIYAPTSSEDKVSATAEKREHCKGRPTVIMLHANAGNVGHRLPLARVFVNRLRCNVVALSYRGYGHSSGSPSESGILMDAQTTLDYVTSHPLFGSTKIVLYGQSLGGAVAVGLAAGKGNGERLGGVILENTFCNMRKLIPAAMPLLGPFAPLCHQTWRSDNRIFNTPASLPFLFLSGSKDELVPPSHFRDLFDLCPSTHKVWRRLVNGTHNDTCVQPGYWQFVSDFIRDEVLHRQPVTSPERKDTFAPGRTKGTEEELKKEGAETLSRL